VTASSASGSPVTVTASVTGVTAPAVFVEDLVAGSPASIQVVSGSGQSAAANTAFASPLVVLVLDSNSIPVANATVSFAGAGLGFAPGSSVTTNSSGLASVTATSASGSPVTVTATVNGATAPAVFMEDLVAGSPASIQVVSGSGQSAAAGTAFINPLVVQVLDGNGIPVANATVSFAGTGLGFAPGASVATNSNGQASVTATSASGNAVTVTATVAGVTAPAVLVEDLVAGSPASIQVVSGSGQITAAGTAFASPLVVLVLDSNRIPVANAVVSFAGTGLGFAPAASVTTNSSGQAIVTASSASGSPVTVTATVNGATAPAVFVEDLVAGSPASVQVVSGSGQSAAANTAFASPLVVQVLDGNRIPVANATVSFAGAGLSFAPAASVATNSSGLASVTASSASASAVTVTATVAGVATPAVFVEDLVAGSPASVQVVSGSGQSAAAGTAFASPLVVQVLDGNGIPVANAAVSFAGTGLGFAPAASVTTNSSGRASVTASSTSGSEVTVTATVAGVATPAVFVEDLVAGSPASIQVVSGSGQSAAAGTAFASPLVVQVLDSNGTPVANAAVSFAGTGLGFAPGASVTTNSSGQASVTATSASGSPVTVTATVAGATAPAVFVEDGTGNPNSPLVTFQASPDMVFLGGGSLLSWTVNGSPALSLSGVGAQSGTSLWVTPTADTTYTLSDSQGDQLQMVVNVRSFTLEDLAGLALAWGSSTGQTSYEPQFDLSGDGKIDDADVALCLAGL
jgi:adhesin/invasin